MEKKTKNIWKIDPAHSRIGFTTKHLGISEVTGYFPDFSVEVSYFQPDYSDISIKVTINIAPIHTGIKMRDDHLKTADFFDVEKHPQIIFESTKMDKSDDNHAKLYGNLTMCGKTKPIDLDVEYFGTVTNPMTEQATAGFKITGAISRQEFALGTSFGANFISDKVKLIVDTEFSPAE